MTNQLTDRTKGLLVMALGVLIISPDAVLTRFLSEGGADAWTIIFWKMLFAVPVSTGFAVWDAGGVANLWQQISDGKRYYPVVVPLQAAVDACFTLSFVYTSAANALLLINLNPLWCALAGRWLLGDVLPTRTCVALVLALGCVLVIFVPELVEQQRNHGELGLGATDDQELGDSSHLGNIIALSTGLCLAAYITLVRHGSMQQPSPVNLIGCTGFASTLAAVVALVVRRGDVLPSSFWRMDDDDDDSRRVWQFWLASLAQGVAVGVIFVCITVAPRLITGAEVGLMILLEALLGPLFVFLAYRDLPSKWTVIGGSILLAVLAVHEAAPLWTKGRNPKPNGRSTVTTTGDRSDPNDESLDEREESSGNEKNIDDSETSETSSDTETKKSDPNEALDVV